MPARWLNAGANPVACLGGAGAVWDPDGSDRAGVYVDALNDHRLQGIVSTKPAVTRRFRRLSK